MACTSKAMEKDPTIEFETKLIVLVKSHCCLYATDNPEYRNKEKRANAWKDISSILGKSVDECQKKWTSLRDTFTSYFINETNIPNEVSTSSPATDIRDHFNDIKFLIPFDGMPGDDCGNYSQDIAAIPLNEEIDDRVDEMKQSPSFSSSKVKKRKRVDTWERVLAAVENSTKRSSMQMFLENIALQVVDFTPKRQLRFQMRILDVLAEELKQEN